MNTKIINLLLMSIFGIGLLLPIPAFAQPNITLWDGSTLNGGFTINNSDKIIFGFEHDPTAGDPSEIDLILPIIGCTFDVEKDSGSCSIGSAPGCSGSLVTVPTLDSGSLMVEYVSGPTGVSQFDVEVTAPVTSGTGAWDISPLTNANIIYARAIPDIKIVPLEAVSGQPGVTLDADGDLPLHEPTEPVYEGTLGVVPSITSYSWTYTGSTPAGAVIALVDPMTSTPSFTAPLVTEFTELTFELTVTDDAGLTAIETVIVPVRPPIDVVLLMDTSGSMGWYHDGSTNDLAGGCCSRLASAKTASSYFVERLGILTTDSRLGVAIFPGEPYPSTVLGAEWNPLTSLTGAAAVTGIQTAIGGDTGSAGACGDCSSAPASPGTPTGIQVNWNGTPTRDGLDAAFDMFPIPGTPEYRSRVILLLSDGAWNIGDDPADTTYLNTNFVTNDIKIYTLGMGTGIDNVNHISLQDISVTTGVGESGSPVGFTTFNLGDASEPNLFPYMEKIMADMISLVFITDPSATIKSKKTNKHKVLVSSHDTLLSFTVSWQSSQTNLLDFYVITANNIKINPQVSGNGYKNVTINRKKEKKPLKDGNWTIVVTNKSRNNIVYNYSAMTKSDLSMRVFLNKALYYTGDTMLIEARLIENNIRFKGTGKVQATIIRPEKGIGEWYLKNEVSKNQLKKFPDIKSRESFSTLDKKRYILQEEGKAKLPERKTEPKIILNDEGEKGDKYPHDGIYSALFKGFVVPGIYKLQITADGEARNGQKFHRETEVEKYVGIRPDPKMTKIEGAVVEKLKGKAGIIGIRITPIDKMKNYLGPGFADKIRIKVYGGKPETEVDDLLNGTYQQFFMVEDINKDWKITITIRGVKVYSGSFLKLVKNR